MDKCMTYISRLRSKRYYSSGPHCKTEICTTRGKLYRDIFIKYCTRENNESSS